MIKYVVGLMQDYNNSSVLADDLLQSCTKPLVYKLLAKELPQSWTKPWIYKLCLVC